MKKFLNKFKNDIIGIVILSTAILLGLSLFSFNSLDPSFNSLTSVSSPKNYCGVVGSFLADILYQGFGLGSWLLCGSLFLIAINIFRDKEIDLKSPQTVGSITFLLVAISLLGLYFPTTKIYSNKIYLGGWLGLILAQGLQKALNFAGAALVLWALVAIQVVFYSEKSVKEIFLLIWNKIQDISFFNKVAKISKNEVARIKSGIDKSIAKPLLAGHQNFGIASEGVLKNEKNSSKADIILSKNKKNDKVSEEDDDENEEIESDEIDILVPESDESALEENSKSSSRRRVVLKAKPPRKVENWDMPKLNLLEDPPATRTRVDKDELRKKAELLTDKLKRFNVDGAVVAVKPGPAVTMFEFKPSADVKLSNITSMENDLAIALSSESLRIIAPIPGRDVVGIESSNSIRETVYLKDLLAEDIFWKEDTRLPIPLGRQANGDPQIMDLRKMPHLLVAGSTGSGKSVFTVGTITGLLFKHSPKTLRMILIDPKQVDLAAFNKIPHLLMPPINEVHKAVGALRWAVKEMEKRYRSMSKFGARGLEDYNEKIAALTPEQIQEHEKINEEFEQDNKKRNQVYYFQNLPYIVIVVEEFGDLMQVDKNNVEQSVVRLAQLARACGIHLMLCMQSPRKEVVTGLIKTNIPGRISFKVASKMDSRIILDEMGAERLLARGDMLFRAPGTDKPARHHGPWVSDPEINKVAKFWSDQAEPEYDPIAMKVLEAGSSSGGLSNSDGGSDFNSGNDGSSEEEYDEMYDQILDFVSTVKEVSASLLQRRFKLGYPRAARLVEIMEKEGVVGPANGSKPRQVLINNLQDHDKG